MLSDPKGKGQLDTCEDIQDAVSAVLKLRDYITSEEELEIHRQFRSSSWKPDSQVLWSGMYREEAQAWADGHNMQTLTTAMGPLMDERAPTCPRKIKPGKTWSKYIHGASAVFAWHIARNDVVVVLSQPPPQKFHPSELSYFQTIEEPILRAAIADGGSLRIDLVHPNVKGAEDFRYQWWPHDETETWNAAHRDSFCHKCKWRMVKGGSAPMISGNESASAAVVAPTIAPKASPKKSKKSKKKKRKSNATCSSQSTAATSSSPKVKTGKLVAPPKAARTESAKSKLAISSNPASNENQLTKKQRKKLKATVTNRPKAEGISKSTKNKPKKVKGTKASASPVNEAPKLSKSAKKKAKKARRAAMTIAEKEKRLTPKECAAKLAKAGEATQKSKKATT